MGEWMSEMGRDVRYAVRRLRRAPAFTVTALLTLALGIGATATMYSVVRDVLLAPLPYADAGRLAGIGFTFPQSKPNDEEAGATADFVREHGKSFESVGIANDSASGANLSTGGGDRAIRLLVTNVSHGYFPTLGVKPLLGRTFTEAEDVPGGPKVVLLNYWVWQRTFGGDRGIVDRVLRINGEPYTVVGVMPEGTEGNGDSRAARATEGLWMPLRLSSADAGYDGQNYVMIGRLRRDAGFEKAQHELDGLTQSFYEQFPSYKKWTDGNALHGYRVWPLQDVLVSEVKRSLLVLLGAVLAVLLVACLNLAGLLTARAAVRQREVALRSALGATRGSLLRLLLAESLVLALAGGALGLGLANVARPLLLANAPMAMPTTGHSGTWGLVGFVFAVSMATTLLCALLPAWTVFRQDVQTALKGGQAAGTTVSQVRMGKGLMIGQVAVAMVLLSAASLLLGSFLKLQTMDSGVVTRRLVVVQVSLMGKKYEKALATQQFVQKVAARLAATPGVERVAAINGLPLDRGLNMGGYRVGSPDQREVVEFRAVTPGYFKTLGISLIAGRDVTDEDRAGGQAVALVNEQAARQWWPGRSPIGERVVVGGKGERELTVVGVVADTRNHSLIAPDRMMIYAPFAQLSDGMTKIVNGWFPTTFTVRLSGDVNVAAAAKDAVSEADAEIPVARVTTMQAVVDHTVAAPRFFSWMASGFAGFALLLTVIGLFGLLSYQVTQRTREIGVRMAIGAGRTEILRLILRRGMVLTGVGLAMGGVVSLAVPRVVGSLLAETMVTGGAPIGVMLSSTTVAVGVAALAMLGAAGVASWLPARRAAGVEPVEALRAE